VHTVSLLALVDDLEAEAPRAAVLQPFTKTIKLFTLPYTHYKRWHQLTKLATGQSHWLSAYSPMAVRGMLDDLFSREHYDAVLFESVLVAGYRLPTGVKKIVDQHNVEHELVHRMYEREPVGARKWYNSLEYRWLKRGEIERCRDADLVLVTSERERRILARLLPGGRIDVVPNGADVSALSSPQLDSEAPDRVVFTGSLDYYPNTQAVQFFARHCWPLVRAEVPSATWEIVGRNPPVEVQSLAVLPGVIVSGSVPSVLPYLAAAAVAVVPLLVGSGTRLKILEALAMGKAVVSTTMGCEGLVLEPGHHLVVADEPEAFARAVVTLLRDPERRAALGAAGRALVEAEYSWERCGDVLLSVLETALEVIA
jgi:glycosyltransferase involved in cell wall biosynthesis